jgi:HemY protein
MRLGVWAVVALMAGAFIAHFVLQDRGYVLINFRGVVVEMSVPGLALLLIAAYAATRGLVALWRAPRRLGAAFAEARLRRAGGQLTDGLIHIAEGDWARAERLLTRGLKHAEAPVANYLLAARAAQLQGSLERRDQWLARARDEGPDAAAAVLLTKAELQFEAGELDRALETLREIEAVHAGHPAAAGLAARVHRARGDRAALAALLPRLATAHLPGEDLEAIAADALAEQVARPDLTQDQLAEAWASVPAELRQSARLIALHADALNRIGRGDDAERQLKAALKRRWHPALVAAYGGVRAADAAKQLRQAEAWLKDHPEDAVLLLTAARLCMLNELWGKARSYLESSLALAPDPASYALYGRLLLQLGDRERAATAFRSGLTLASGPDVDLPALDSPPPPAAVPSRAPILTAPDRKSS